MNDERQAEKVRHKHAENSASQYLLEKCRFGMNFFAKRITTLLLNMCKVFYLSARSSLFFLAFFLQFYGTCFLNDPVSCFFGLQVFSNAFLYLRRSVLMDIITS